MTTFVKYISLALLLLIFACSRAPKHYNEKAVEAIEVPAEEVESSNDAYSEQEKSLELSKDKQENELDEAAVSEPAENKESSSNEINKEDWVKESLQETLDLVSLANDKDLDSEIRDEAKKSAESLIDVLPDSNQIKNRVHLKRFNAKPVSSVNNNTQEMEIEFTVENDKGEIQTGTSRAKISTQTKKIDESNYTEFKVKFDSISVQKE